HSRHWYWNVIGAEPFHVPGLALRVLPVVALPPIVGGELLLGATAVLLLTAAAVPTAISATTTAAIRPLRRRRSAGICPLRSRVIGFDPPLVVAPTSRAQVPTPTTRKRRIAKPLRIPHRVLRLPEELREQLRKPLVVVERPDHGQMERLAVDQL